VRLTGGHYRDNYLEYKQIRGRWGQELESSCEDRIEPHRLDLALESAAIERFDAGIAPRRDAATTARARC
jgi:hypothetical protein